MYMRVYTVFIYMSLSIFMYVSKNLGESQLHIITIMQTTFTLSDHFPIQTYSLLRNCMEGG